MNSGRSDTLLIYLVDDNPFDVELMTASLQAGMTCRVTSMSSREELLAALDAELPDILISDSNIPRFDGTEVFELMRQKYPSVPFVFCSGAVTPEIRSLASELGARAWVSKNELEQLATVVKQVCAGKRQL